MATQLTDLSTSAGQSPAEAVHSPFANANGELSGVVHGLVADLSGVVVNSTKIVEVLPKLVVASWGLNLEKDKVQEQVLGAVRVLVARCVAEAEKPTVQAFVDSVVPVVIGALYALAAEVEAAAAKKAEEVGKKVVEKVQSSAVGRWFAGLCGKVVAAVAGAPATAPATAAPVAAEVAAPVPAEVAAPVPAEVAAPAVVPEVAASAVVPDVVAAAAEPAPVPEVAVPAPAPVAAPDAPAEAQLA
jgi:hypothetical protein